MSDHDRQTEQGISDLRRLTTLAVVALIVMVIGGLTLIGVRVISNQQHAVQEVIARIDRNAEISQRAVSAIICVLQLSVDPNAPPRTTPNVGSCLEKYGFPTQSADERSSG